MKVHKYIYDLGPMFLANQRLHFAISDMIYVFLNLKKGFNEPFLCLFVAIKANF